MTLRTYTLATSVGKVTIGWSNVARYPAFRHWLDGRLHDGYAHTVQCAKGRTVLYNVATVTNRGVSPSEIKAVSAIDPIIAQFLRAGDISIVRLDNTTDLAVPQIFMSGELLDHDVVEVQCGKA